jgi:hypothetical protein
MKSIVKTSTLLVLLFSVFVGCSKKNRCSQIEESIQSIKIGSEFSLDTLNTAKWDTVYIMEPYSYDVLDTLNIQNIPSGVKTSLKSRLGRDTYCALIFTEKLNYVNHAFIRRNIDFSWLENIKYPADQIYYLAGNKRVSIPAKKN